MSNFQSSIMKEKTLKQGHVGVYHLAEIFSVEALKFKKASLYTKFDSLMLSGSLLKPASLGPPRNIAQHHPTFGAFSLLNLWKYINQSYLPLSSVFFLKKC